MPDIVANLALCGEFFATTHRSSSGKELQQTFGTTCELMLRSNHFQIEPLIRRFDIRFDRLGEAGRIQEFPYPPTQY